MDEIQAPATHPNWVALATVNFKPKIFIKSSEQNANSNVNKKEKSIVAINESACLAYNEILQMPSTAPKPSTRPSTAISATKVHRKKKKIVRKKFSKESLFKLAMADDPEGIQNLLEQSIDPELNATDDFGWTALMMSACEGAVGSFQKLLENGADLTISDKKGNTAESLAKKKGFNEILRIAVEHENCQSPDISDKEEEQEEEEQGTLFCSECGIEVSKKSSYSHQTSTVHLFSCKFKGRTDIKSFGIARSNRGFQMMRRSGWDGNSALGASQKGKLYPIKTVIRKSRTGLGIEQDSAKVTHFEAYETRAVHFKPPPRALTRKEILDNDLKDKRREQRLRQALS